MHQSKVIQQSVVFVRRCLSECKYICIVALVGIRTPYILVSLCALYLIQQRVVFRDILLVEFQECVEFENRAEGEQTVETSQPDCTLSWRGKGGIEIDVYESGGRECMRGEGRGG